MEPFYISVSLQAYSTDSPCARSVHHCDSAPFPASQRNVLPSSFQKFTQKNTCTPHLFYTKKGILQHGSAIGFKRSKCNYGKNCFKPWIWKYTVGISIIDVGLNGEILLTWLCCLVLVGTLHWESMTQTPTKELQSHFYMSCQRADLSFILQPCDLDIFSWNAAALFP